MDKSDKTISRREFIRVVGGALVATELGVTGCTDKNATPSEIGSNAGQGGDIQGGNQAGNTGGSGSPAAAGSSAQAGSGLGGKGGDGRSGSGTSGSGGSKPTATAGRGGSQTQPSTAGKGATAGSGGSTSKADAGPVDNGKSKVYIVKTNDRVSGIEKVLTMAGGLGFAAGRDVVLKPNFNSTYELPATTHDDTIRTIVNKLKAAKAGNITLGESAGSTTFTVAPTETVIQAKGTLNLCSELGIEFLSYDDPSVEYESFQVDNMTWNPAPSIPKLMRSNRVKILMPCCKTHFLGDYSFSLKLAVGLIPRSRRGGISEMHTALQEKIAEINVGFKPDLIVMDAMLCFIDNGPDTGTTASPGLIVAATDRVALDAVGVAILRSAGSVTPAVTGKIFQSRQIARAVQLGLGAKSPDDIELIGEDTATVSNLRSILDNG